MPAPPPRPDRPDPPDRPNHGEDPSGARPAAPAEPSRERPRWIWILLPALLVVAVGAIGVITSISSDVSRSSTVVYEVTGTARDVSITYVTWERENRVVHSAKASELPWRERTETSGFVRGQLLEVMTGPGGGSVTCSVTVDDGKPRTSTAIGRYATAECSF